MKLIDSVTQFFKRPTVHRVLFYLVLAAFVIPFTFSKVVAPDLFKALYTGRYISLLLEIPHHSEFTFSPVKPFFPAEAFNWLVNLLLFGLLQLGDYITLQLFKIFLAFFFLIMAHSLMDFRINPFSLLLLVVMLYGIQQKFLVRNAIVLIPFGILLMWLWRQFRVRQQWQWGMGFLVLFLFWGNMHGTYLVGIGLLGLFVAGDALDGLYRSDHPGWRWPVWGSGILLVSLFIVVFMKPFPDYTIVNVGKRVIQKGGGGMVSNLWYGGEDSVSDSEQSLETSTAEPVKETNRLSDGGSASTSNEIGSRARSNQPDSWRLRLYLDLRHFLQNTVFDTSRPSAGGKSFPLSPTKPYMFTALGILIILVTLGCFAVSVREFRLSEFLPFIAASVIGLGYVRTVALIPIVVMPILFIKFSRGDFDHLTFGSTANVASTFVLIALFSFMGFHLVDNELRQFTNAYLHFGAGKANRYSTKLPQFILENYPEQKMYNRYMLGTFLIWNWWPKKKVFVDGKSLAYDPDFIEDVYYKRNEVIANKHNLSFMILPLRRDSPYYWTIPDPGWEVVAFDLGMILFRKVPDGEEATDVDAREVMLYSDEEFQQLPESSQSILSAVTGFINEYQNNRDHMKTFTSPYHRYNEDLKELYDNLEVNSSAVNRRFGQSD